MTIANQHLQAANARLILIGGLPGSGKSTLARRLGEEMNCRVISSDLVRKELVGLEPWEHAPAEWQKGIYSPQHTLDTYSQMLDDATDCISKGRSVILDASWSDPSMRDRAAKVAEQTGAEIISILCVASAMEISRRLSKRGKTGSGVSDANLKIAVRMSQGVDTWPAAWRLDTTGNEEEAFEKLVGVIKGDFGAAQSVTGV